MFVDGITRMTAPAAALDSRRVRFVTRGLFLVGVLGVMFSGVLFLFDGRYPGVAPGSPPDAPDTQFRDGAP